MAFKRVVVLLWSDVLAGYAMWVLQTYLTDVWKLSFTHAAGIINIGSGLAKALPLLFVFMVDSWMGDYLMLLLSSIAYAIGMGFLFMSTPPVLSKSTHSCRDYKPKCIGHVHEALFFTALALITIGISGHIVSLVPFSAQQKEDESDDQTQANRRGIQFQPLEAMVSYMTEKKIHSFRICLLIIVPVIAIIALPYIKPWSLRFGIPAICTLAATLLFLSGSFSYRYHKAKGCPVTNVFRVLVAAGCKTFCKHPENIQDLYKYEDCANHNVEHTRGLRFLEKAAIVLKTKSLEEQENNRWRLCTVAEVEETKIALRLIRLSISFIICGVISSIGNTYFVEQAKKMDFKVGKIKAPITILLLLFDTSKSVLKTFYFSMAECNGKNFAARIGIAVAIIFSVLCSITASKFETRRINAIVSHGLLDKPDQTIPMSAFWLLPQYILLAGHDSFFENSIGDFFDDQIPTSMKMYLIYFTQACSGVGMMGSVLSVYAVGRVSEREGHPNWFQYTLNKSRLDKYYWVLAVLSAANLIWYIYAVVRFSNRNEVDHERYSNRNEVDHETEEM